MLIKLKLYTTDTDNMLYHSLIIQLLGVRKSMLQSKYYILFFGVRLFSEQRNKGAETAVFVCNCVKSMT